LLCGSPFSRDSCSRPRRKRPCGRFRSAHAIAALKPHRQRVSRLAPEDLVFGNRKGDPLRESKLLRSVLQPAHDSGGVGTGDVASIPPHSFVAPERFESASQDRPATARPREHLNDAQPLHARRRCLAPGSGSSRSEICLPIWSGPTLGAVPTTPSTPSVAASSGLEAPPGFEPGMEVCRAPRWLRMAGFQRVLEYSIGSRWVKRACGSGSRAYPRADPLSPSQPRHDHLTHRPTTCRCCPWSYSLSPSYRIAHESPDEQRVWPTTARHDQWKSSTTMMSLATASSCGYTSRRPSGESARRPFHEAGCPVKSVTRTTPVLPNSK